MLSIFAVVLAGFLFVLPNILTSSYRIQLEKFLPLPILNLGLDLQGGSHLLLEVDVDSNLQERLEVLRSDIRLALREAHMRYHTLTIIGDKVSVHIRQAKKREKAEDLFRNLYISNASYSGNNELLVESDNVGSLMVSFSPSSLTARNVKIVKQSIEIIRRRIDALGTTEPIIQRQGHSRIVVQVPGIAHSDRLRTLLGQTAKMNFHMIDTSVSARDILNGAALPVGSKLLYGDGESVDPYVIRQRVMISGNHLADASVGFDQKFGTAEVNFRFDSIGGKKFGEITKNNIGSPFAIVLDNKVISAPMIQSAILGGSGRITGNFSVETANNLAILLRAGALPAPLNILEERTVGPSLGSDSIRAGRRAAITSFIAVMIFIGLSYSLFGLFANIALFINMILIIAILSLLQATLTLPGIAGIVLTIGMAVDANVLIFERIREELRQGKTSIIAIDLGYKKAFGTILDANVTTLIAAFTFIFLGAGPIRGFAITLSIGIVTSIFTAFTLTKLLIFLWLNNRRKLDKIPL